MSLLHKKGRSERVEAVNAGDFKYIFDVVNRASYTTLVFLSFRFLPIVVVHRQK